MRKRQKIGRCVESFIFVCDRFQRPGHSNANELNEFEAEGFPERGLERGKMRCTERTLKMCMTQERLENVARRQRNIELN